MAKKVTIQYRQLKTAGLGPEADLQGMLVDMLRRRKWVDSAKTRILDLDQDESFVILNKVSDPATWDGPIFAGQIIHLQSGTDVQAVLQSLEEDTAEFVVHNLDVGERTRVLRGALYFAVVGNHVGLIEGQLVRGRTLERYLTALFQRGDELDAGQAIILNGSFTTDDGKALTDTDEITVNAVPNRGANVPARDTATAISEREAATERGKGATVFDVLRTLGWQPEAIESLRAEVPADGSIEGSFKVFIKERNRRKRISRATVNEALRNIDPADIGLRGDGTEKGGIVKLSVQRPVASTGSLLDPTDAMEQIVNALREWANAGKIDCTFAS